MPRATCHTTHSPSYLSASQNATYSNSHRTVAACSRTDVCISYYTFTRHATAPDRGVGAQLPNLHNHATPLARAVMAVRSWRTLFLHLLSHTVKHHGPVKVRQLPLPTQRTHYRRQLPIRLPLTLLPRPATSSPSCLRLRVLMSFSLDSTCIPASPDAPSLAVLPIPPRWRLRPSWRRPSPPSSPSASLSDINSACKTGPGAASPPTPPQRRRMKHLPLAPISAPPPAILHSAQVLVTGRGRRR